MESFDDNSERNRSTHRIKIMITIYLILADNLEKFFEISIINCMVILPFLIFAKFFQKII